MIESNESNFRVKLVSHRVPTQMTLSTLPNLSDEQMSSREVSKLPSP